MCIFHNPECDACLSPASNSHFICLQIGLNGVVTFDRGISGYIPEPFPLYFPLIALFWTDIDTRFTGLGYWRLIGPRDSSTEDQFLKVDDLVVDTGIDHYFYAENILVITWDRAGFYGSSVGNQVVSANRVVFPPKNSNNNNKHLTLLVLPFLGLY